MERTCKFIPQRNNRLQCEREILASDDNKYFCKRHSNTLQAQSYSNYEEGNKRETTASRSPTTDSRSPNAPGGRGKKYKKVQIVQNKYGNFEDKDSGIVFDKTTRKARGYQNHDTGKVHALSPHHIFLCKKNYWDYNTTPNNKEELKEEQPLTSDSSKVLLSQTERIRRLRENEQRVETSEREQRNREKKFQLEQRERRVKEREEKLKREQEVYWKNQESQLESDDESDESDDEDAHVHEREDAHVHAREYSNAYGNPRGHPYEHSHGHPHGHPREHPRGHPHGNPHDHSHGNHYHPNSASNF